MSHPSEQQLSDFLLGRLDDSQRDDLEQHILGCDSCCAALSTVESRSDPLVELARVAGTKAGSVTSTSLHESADAPQTTDAGPPKELLDHPRYQLKRKIGQGGMGVVYRAEHTLMERPVALKVISQHLIDKPNAVDRFRQEVRAAARLSHPNIVTAFDAEQAGQLHFLVMEFVDGVSLSKQVEVGGRLSVNSALRFMKQAVAGLDHAHSKDMVHRDIKPHNLMISRADKQLKILDFGLSRFASERRAEVLENNSPDQPSNAELTSIDMVLGTPDYIAPEQIDDPRSADIRADIYSLGCTFYFLLAGHPPFPAGNSMKKLACQQYETPRPIREIRPDVPASVAAVLEKMLAKRPEERYQTPKELQLALRELKSASANVDSVTAPPVSSPPVSSPPVTESPQQTTAPPIITTDPGPASRRRSKRSAVGNGTIALVAVGALLLLSLAALPWLIPSTPRVLYVLPHKNLFYDDFGPVRDELERQGVSVTTASVEETAFATPDSGGGDVRVDVLLDSVNIDDYDAIAFAGGYHQIWGPYESTYSNLIAEADKKEKVLAGICIGQKVLGILGALDGHKASILHNIKQEMLDRGAIYDPAAVVTSDNIVTARDTDDGVQFARAIIQALKLTQ